MPTPGFPAGTLSVSGFPAWLDDLTEHFMLHVVRGLTPADALAGIGARPATFMSCALPGEQADVEAQLSLPVYGQCDAVLLAGQVGAWTFVYDGLGDTGEVEDPQQRYSFVPTAKILSADGREAASTYLSVNADTLLTYAVDGDLLLDMGEYVDPQGHDIPAGLGAAVESAGTFVTADEESHENDGPDMAVNIRVVCALAGLNLTQEGLRKIPLIGAPLG
jgi:hypothetical protein